MRAKMTVVRGGGGRTKCEKREKKEREGESASSHLSARNGVESFHSEGNSSSFTDREALYLCVRPFSLSSFLFVEMLSALVKIKLF